MSEPTLLLRKKQFGSCWRSDYTVVERRPDGSERVIGCMYSGAGARGDKWVYAIEGVGSWSADSQEDAMAALKTRWRRESKNDVGPF